MKYLTILMSSAALLAGAILATGGELDLSSLIAILAASCLPAGLAYEYRNELWPARSRQVTGARPVTQTATITQRPRAAVPEWVPAASPALASTVWKTADRA